MFSLMTWQQGQQKSFFKNAWDIGLYIRWLVCSSEFSLRMHVIYNMWGRLLKWIQWDVWNNILLKILQ
jgi:hypothetical protein